MFGEEIEVFVGIELNPLSPGDIAGVRIDPLVAVLEKSPAVNEFGLLSVFGQASGSRSRGRPKGGGEAAQCFGISGRNRCRCLERKLEGVLTTGVGNTVIALFLVLETIPRFA